MSDKTDKGEPHELFLPLEPGDDPVFPVWLSIEREKPFRETRGGAMRPDELPDEAAIAECFGSGTYYVRARDERKRVICARRYTIRNAGPPKSMDGSGETVEGFATPGGQVLAAPPAQHREQGELAMMIAWLKEQSTSSHKSAQEAIAAERERAQAFIATMQAAATSQQKILMDFVGAQLAAAKTAAVVDSGGKTAFDEAFSTFQAGMTFATEMASQLRGGEGEGGERKGDALEDTIAQLAQGWFAARMAEGKKTGDGGDGGAANEAAE